VYGTDYTSTGREGQQRDSEEINMNTLDAVLISIGIFGLIVIGFGLILMGQIQSPMFDGAFRRKKSSYVQTARLARQLVAAQRQGSQAQI
jgi:hypothetical protein